MAAEWTGAEEAALGHRGRARLTQEVQLLAGVVTFLVRAATNLWTLLEATEVRMSPLLSVEEAAAELGTPVRFVRRLIHERRIRFHKIGKYVRISRHDLEAFVDAAGVDPWPGERKVPKVPLPVAPDA